MSRFLRQSEPIIGSGSLATLASTKPQFDPYADCVQCGRKLPKDRFTTCCRECYLAYRATFPPERRSHPHLLWNSGTSDEANPRLFAFPFVRLVRKFRDATSVPFWRPVALLFESVCASVLHTAEPPVRGPGKNGA